MPNLFTYIEARKTLSALRRLARPAQRTSLVRVASKTKTIDTGNSLGLSAEEFAEVMAEVRPVILRV